MSKTVMTRLQFQTTVERVHICSNARDCYVHWEQLGQHV